MADKKITDLQLRANVSDTLSFPSDDGIQSYRVTGTQLRDYTTSYAGMTAKTEDTEPSLLDLIITGDVSASAAKKVSLESLAKYLRAKNFIDNGAFRWWQRQVATTLTSRQDAQYGADRWYFLTGGGAVNCQGRQVAETVSPTAYVGQFRQADATARQFGVAQIIESDEAIKLRGKKVTLSFKARTDGTEVPNIRVGIIEWTGTANAVTRDIVSAWATNPTLIANATFINTPASIALTASMQTIETTVTLGTTFNNLIVFVWTPATAAQDADFYLAQVQLVDAATRLPWESVALDYSLEEDRMHRFLEKSSPDYYGGAAIGTGQPTIFTNGDTYNTSAIYEPFRFKKRKIKTAGVVSITDGAGNIGKYSTIVGGGAATHNRTPGDLVAFFDHIILQAGSTGAHSGFYMSWMVDADL